MEEVVVRLLLVDWLTLGDLARLHEAACDRDASSPELRHVIRARLHLATASTSTSSSFTRVLSTHMLGAKTRCCECGAPCRRRSHVCFACAVDERSFRAMVSRNDLRQPRTDGFRVKERRLLQALAPVRVVTTTYGGAYLYWRREALAALLRG